MARPLRLEFPHAVYYVTSRGNARQKIVRGDEDRHAFLSALAHVVDRFGWYCHAYCLMNNQYHLLVETPQPNLSLGMRQLNGPYTQAFNRRHRRVGHLFQGRFKAILVEKDAYLLELCRYVVLNPVRAKLVKHPKQWIWSSYRATVGQVTVPEYLTVDWILENFARRARVAQQRYQAFVLEGIGAESPWDELQGQMYLGSEVFVARHQPNELLQEFPRFQTLAYRPSVAELFAKRGSRERHIATAYRKYGYRLWEIGNHLGVHYSTVSRLLRCAEEQDS